MASVKDILEPGCSAEEKKKKLEKMYDKFSEDVEDAFNEIISQVYGDFFKILLALTAQLGLKAALDYGSFVGAMVTRNVVGGFTSSVGLAVSTLNGSKTLLKYSAAKSLLENLERRRELSKGLLTDVNSLLDLLISFENVNITLEGSLFIGLEEALLSTKKAAEVVRRENNKIISTRVVQTTHKPVSPYRLEIAIDHIKDALDALGGTDTPENVYKDGLKNLNKKYSIQVSPDSGPISSVSVTNPLAVKSYFEDLAEAWRKKYSVGGVLTYEGQEAFKQYIIDFISLPGINDYIRSIGAFVLVGKHMDNLGKKLPIRSSLTANLAKSGVKNSVGSIFGKKTEGGFDDLREDISSYFNFQIRSATGKYPKDTTLKFSGAEVRDDKASILLIDERFDSLQVQTGYLKKFLDPALNKLLEVAAEIEDELATNKAPRK